MFSLSLSLSLSLSVLAKSLRVAPSRNVRGGNPGERARSGVVRRVRRGGKAPGREG